MARRTPLTPQRVVGAAAAVADRDGLAAVTMRTVGRELGVEAMSLYHHISGKEALLDALTDWVFAQIEPPDHTLPWREAVRGHAASTRRVLSAHPWSLTLIETRSAPGAAVLSRHDAFIGCLRRGGFSVRLTSHAISLIDAYVYGFVLTERNLPFEPDGASEFVEQIDIPWEMYPHVTELVGELTQNGDYSFAAEFDIGLDMILDTLERLRGQEQG